MSPRLEQGKFQELITRGRVLKFITGENGDVHVGVGNMDHSG